MVDKLLTVLLPVVLALMLAVTLELAVCELLAVSLTVMLALMLAVTLELAVCEPDIVCEPLPLWLPILMVLYSLLYGVFHLRAFCCALPSCHF